MSDIEYERLRRGARNIREDLDLDESDDAAGLVLAAAEALADLGPLLDKLQRMHPFHAVCGCAPCQLWAAWTTARAKLVTT